MAGTPSDDELANTATAAGAGPAADRPSGAKLEGTLGRYRLEKMLGEGWGPRESWNDECRWQSTKPGVATVRRPSTLRAGA